MRKIEKRAVLCLIIALALIAGLGLFCFRFVTNAADWAAYPYNRHMYSNSGQLLSGTILDRDGDVLTEVKDGERVYYPDATVRRATVHAVGDGSGYIGTGALTAFADRLSGYNLITGGYSPLGSGRNLTLTLDAYLNVTAYNAMDGRQGTVGVYNYKTGDILCMVSTPSFDPENPPAASEAQDGIYLNRFLSSAQVPGSIFKTVTLTAALENLPDLKDRTFTCTGETTVGGTVITCPKPHGKMDIASAFANSCNGVFGALAAELGGDTMTKYVEQAGLTRRMSVDGIMTAAGHYDVRDADKGQIGWSGVGQYTDTVNPCNMMTYMGAIANGGTAAVPRLILDITTPSGIPTSWQRTEETDTLVQASTASQVKEMMKNNVVQTYGTDRFRGLDIGAKSGTAEVGGDKRPNAWFAGFLDDPEHPYAFIVLVENGGGGASVAGEIAATVLQACVDKF
ncbi:penicillin-binding transpeptidase domain-containing protein [Butyricicoccus pullicaecorum]|uniref:Penicillin-binding protein n=1 Tax=Butyricicoccus pullicaecorum TaxID=501571 RepID=A0A1Y4LUW8_9FIRM|nr:penicillin-binding transpeptidase domain-containing protein [Butyricicoccus pullicaecorum]OUP59670.1 penicillin-binding protein [Butyricicoccus pullicaecorum]